LIEPAGAHGDFGGTVDGIAIGRHNFRFELIQSKAAWRYVR
jgi:hypothetical protein